MFKRCDLRSRTKLSELLVQASMVGSKEANGALFWRGGPIACSKFEKIPFRKPCTHFLEVPHSSDRRGPAGFRRAVSWFRRQLGPPAPRPAFEDMTVVEEAVEHGGDGGTIAEQFSPVLNWTVRSHQSAHAFVAAHDDL